MLTFKVEQLLKGVILRMIGKQKQARRVIESNVIIFASVNIARAESEHRFNREVIIGNTIRLTDVNVVIVNAANCNL